MTSQPPSPYRFKSTSLNLQIPDIGQHEWLSRSKFFNNMAQTETWRTTQKLWRTFKTWSRRTIWGDRLFLQFEGPSRILIQSRGPTISETLTTRQINEIADAPAGVTQEAVNKATPAEEGSKDALAAEAAPKTTKMNTATISRNGQVHIKPSDAKSTV
ncbi:Altered inheritance of mitochondria protein 24, mitochondrial [Ascosphaera atra]|nr:Altered inheritance of mitochondria protein 24, mitochondrial [Ascosphaera atra]